MGEVSGWVDRLGQWMGGWIGGSMDGWVDRMVGG